VVGCAQTLATTEIGFAVCGEATNAIDAALLEHHHLCPGAHQPIGNEDITETKQVPKRAQHPQLALSLARVAADAQIKDRPTGLREDAAMRARGKARPGFRTTGCGYSDWLSGVSGIDTEDPS
jgi:hypothetical protein